MALRFVHVDYTSDYYGILSISKLPSLKRGRERSIDGLNSFMYKAPRIWNTLPIQNRTASSLPGFMVLIKK